MIDGRRLGAMFDGRWTRTLVLGATLAAAGCGDDGAGAGGGGGAGAGGNALPDDAAVVYEGGATDEALVELRALTPTDDPAQAANFTAPDDGATLPASTPPTFTWALPRHGDPVNGLAFRLLFRGEDGAVALEVFTTLESYTPDAAAWALVADAADPVEVDLVSAAFESNRVAQGGGPFQGGRVTFMVE